MWCRQCQADVVAEAIPDSRRVLCATCGTDITPAITPVPSASTDSGKSPRHPRELLARWAEQDASDVLGPLFRDPPRREAETGAGMPPPSAPAGPPGPVPNSQREPQPAGTSDTVARSPSTSSQPVVAPAREETGLAPPRRMSLPSLYRNWPAEDESVSRPFDTDEEDASRLPLIGQMFAYLGVLTLFVGSVLVLLGHFGNLPNYAPTGWIVATAGQMLLFLGVVTLISAGLEQARELWRRSHAEVAARLSRLEAAVQERDECSSPESGPVAPTASRRAKDARIVQLTAEIERLRAA